MFPNGDALSQDNNSQEASQEEVEAWRNAGPLGKLHNIVVYIQRSPQRQATFEKYSDGKRLPRDNKTRWNSWYLMLHNALDDNMKKAIIGYCHKEYYDLCQDELTPSDWIVLSHIHDFLQFFYEATLATEGREATLERVLLSMEFLLEQLEKGKQQFQDDIILSPCFNSAWKVINKYYALTERYVIVLSIVLSIVL